MTQAIGESKCCDKIYYGDIKKIAQVTLTE